jgi:hypothetical protein
VNVFIALLLLLTLAGVGILMAANGSFDLSAPFNPLQSLISSGENGLASSTPTQQPIMVAAPALGSEAGAFAAYFGAGEPTLVADATAQYQAQIAGQTVSLRVQFGLGVDHHERVMLIGASDPSLSGWDATTADAVCATFLPVDAHLREFIHVADETEYVYTSASMAALFSPAYFVGDGGELVGAGTFNRLDQPALDTTHAVGGCTLALGQHYSA